MNILSISQLQTPNAQADFTILPVQSETSGETEKSSFSDFLRDAQRDLKNADEKISTEESEKIVKYEEKSDSKVEENGEKIEKDEKLGGQNPKSEKIAEKKSSQDEKNQKKIKDSDESDENALKISVQNLNILADAKVQNQNGDEKSFAEDEISILLDETVEIDEKTLSWLTSADKINENDGISNEDFAKLIDSAIEFVPGEETEEEKLENAQNLAANDPELFLKTTEIAENLETDSLIAKNAVPIDDKKIAVDEKINKDKPKISVHDLRTRYISELDAEKSQAKINSNKIVQKSAEKKEINLSLQKQADGNLSMTMELANKAQENITSSNQAASANGSNFQAMLSNAVQENAPEFVKAGNIVLKDGNQGTINLVLRPEGLGNVKISLNLDDKNLSAQILVHTKEAMEAFKESIPSLKQAFTESGFETGSFDLNFSNSQQGFAQSGNEGQNQQNSGILAQKAYGDFITPSAFSQENNQASYEETNYGINIVA